MGPDTKCSHLREHPPRLQCQENPIPLPSPPPPPRKVPSIPTAEMSSLAPAVPAPPTRLQTSKNNVQRATLAPSLAQRAGGGRGGSLPLHCPLRTSLLERVRPLARQLCSGHCPCDGEVGQSQGVAQAHLYGRWWEPDWQLGYGGAKVRADRGIWAQQQEGCEHGCGALSLAPGGGLNLSPHAK